MNLRRLLIFLVCSFASICSAQEVSRTVIKLSGAGSEGPAEAAAIFASPSIMGADGFSFLGKLPDDPIGLLQRPQIQEEIELSQDQIGVVKELQKDISRQMSQIFASQAKFGGDAGQLVGEASKAIRKNIEAELTTLLSPKQLRRLGEIEVQMKIKNRGALALLDQTVSKRLDLSDEQKKDLKEQQRVSQKELAKEIERLREKYRQDVIKDVLDKKQLLKLEEMSGQEYDLKQPNWRRFGISK